MKKIIIILGLFLSIAGFGQTTYTANPGTTELQTYLDLVLNPGDTVIALNGVHELTSMIFMDANGTEANPVVFIGESREGVIIKHKRHASGDYVIRALSPTYLIIRDMTFHGYYQEDTLSNRCPLRFDNGNNVSVINCDIGHSSRNLINLSGVRDILIDSCYIHDAVNWDGQFIDAHGIIGYEPRNITVSNTKIERVSGDCIQMDPDYDTFEWDSLFLINDSLLAGTLDTGYFDIGLPPIPLGISIGENGLDTKTPFGLDKPAGFRAYLYMENVVVGDFSFDTTARATRNYNDRAGLLLKQAINVVANNITIYNCEYAIRARGYSYWDIDLDGITVEDSLGSARVSMTDCFLFDNDIPLWFEQRDLEYMRLANSVIERGRGNSMVISGNDTLTVPARPDLWVELRSWEQDSRINDLSGVNIINSAFPDNFDSVYVGDNIYIDSLNMSALEVPDYSTFIAGDGLRYYVNPNTLPTAFSAVPADFAYATALYQIDTTTTVINIDFRGSNLTDNFNDIIYTASAASLFDSNNVATSTTVTVSGFNAGSDTYGTGTSGCYFPDTTLRGGMNLPTVTNGYITFHNVVADYVDIHLMGLRSAIAGSYIDYTVNDSTQRGLTGNTLLPCSELVTYTNIPVVGDSVQILAYSDYALGGYLNAMDIILYAVDSTEALSVSFSSTDATCYGGSDGSATAIPAGGVAPYTYLWNIDSTTAGISGLSVGWYSVAVTDANDSTITDSVYISSPTQISISGSVTNTTGGLDNGAINITVSGGTSPYGFSWSPGGSVDEDLINLAAGTYTVTVTDNVGCINNRAFNVLDLSESFTIIHGTKTIPFNNKIIIFRR